MAEPHLRVAEAKSNHQVLDFDLDAIIHAQARNDEGLTTEEWGDSLGVGVYKIRKMLKYGIEQGLFSHGVQMRKTYNGKIHRFDVYKYVG